MVIGGYAVVYHGESRFTDDIDITLGIDSGMLPHLLSILGDDFAARVSSPEDFVDQTNVLPLRDRVNSVDVDLLFSFIDFERNAIQRAETVNLDGQPVQIVTAEDLIVYKIIAGRPRDLEDAKSILDRKRSSLDTETIDKNLRQLSDLMDRNDIFDTWKQVKSRGG